MRSCVSHFTNDCAKSYKLWISGEEEEEEGEEEEEEEEEEWMGRLSEGAGAC